jgi:hypothetical protein
MIEAINTKFFELLAWARSERGQTSAEYTAVTAVGVGIAITVVFVLLRTAISDAIGEIATQLTSAVPFS